MDSNLGDRLHRALNRQSVQHEESRRVTIERTTRDTHPTTGSKPLLQQATAGGVTRGIASLNGPNGERLFAFGVAAFGWGSGLILAP